MDTLQINNILVPIDFSEASLNALDTAAAMAKRHDARLTLLHVINENLLSYGHFEVLPITSPVLEIMHDEAKDTVTQIAAGVKDKYGIEVICDTTHGFVPPEICKYAEKASADLMVMGTHGASGFREFFIGTNAFAVVKHAPCPVLTVPPNRKWESFSNILFPVRNTVGALEKYAFLRKIIRCNNATLLVLGLPETSRPDSKNWVDDNVRRLKSDLSYDGVIWRTEILEATDRAASEVLETAAREETDLIAITASLDYDIRDFFIGPYTQQIVNHAKVPVLSIRPAPLPNDARQALQTIRADYGPAVPGLSLPYTGAGMISSVETP